MKQQNKSVKKLEVGKDYIDTHDSNIIVIDRVGIFGNKGFYEDLYRKDIPCINYVNWREATEEEVIEAFKRHLIHRYGEDWETMKIKEMHPIFNHVINDGSCNVNISKYFDDWIVWNVNGVIYTNGIWVERLEEPENKQIMKSSKMLELIENLKVGEKVVIEKFKDHLFVEKKSRPTEWNLASSGGLNVICKKCGGSMKAEPCMLLSDPIQFKFKCESCNITDTRFYHDFNKHGADLSILNKKDWFYVETPLFKYLFKGDMFNENRRNLTYSHHRGSLGTTGIALCDKDNITLLRKATPEDLAPFFEEYPQYAPIKLGDWGLFYDNVEDIEYEIEEELITIWKLKNIDAKYGYSTSSCWYKHFFKVSENETIAEIKERFLKENGGNK